MSRAAERQPMPMRGEAKILPLVVSDLIDRSEMGFKKYGTYLESDNGRDALMDAYQEALDLVMYLRQEIEERIIGGELPCQTTELLP
jgi:hypothetical protein